MKHKTQRELAWSLGYSSTKYVRDLVNSMRQKGWGVCGDSKGMYRTEAQPVKDAQAASLLARANSIMAAAEGLVRKDKDELTLEEQMLWLSLDEKVMTEEEIKTTFDYITEEELR